MRVLFPPLDVSAQKPSYRRRQAWCRFRPAVWWFLRLVLEHLWSQIWMALGLIWVLLVPVQPGQRRMDPWSESAWSQSNTCSSASAPSLPSQPNHGYPSSTGTVAADFSSQTGKPRSHRYYLGQTLNARWHYKHPQLPLAPSPSAWQTQQLDFDTWSTTHWSSLFLSNTWLLKELYNLPFFLINMAKSVSCSLLLTA